MAIPTENEGTRGTESAARCGCVLRKHIGFVMLSAGSTLGLRAPNLRQRAIGSLDSLHLIRRVSTLYAARAIWVQRRLAKLQFMVWQVVWYCAAASGSRTAAAPKPAPKSHWLSGLSSFDSQRECIKHSKGRSGITKTRPAITQSRTGWAV